MGLRLAEEDLGPPIFLPLLPSSAIQVHFEDCKLNNLISLNCLFFFLTYWTAHFKCKESQQLVVICMYILHNPFSEPQFLLDFLFSILSSKAL